MMSVNLKDLEEELVDGLMSLIVVVLLLLLYVAKDN